MMRKRLVSAYISSVFSISLVLLLVGLASLLLVNASNVSSYFKEHVRISVIFSLETSEKQALEFKEGLDTCRYVLSTELVSREQGIKEMEGLLGEDFLSVFETAPVPVSIDLTLKAEYVSPEQVESIVQELSSREEVSEVVWQKSVVEKLSSNVKSLSYLLFGFIAALLFICFALISNTVRLNLYSKRFSIHTMRLVGATKSFIARPFLAQAAFQGVLAALIAIIVMLVGLIVVKRQMIQLFTIFRLEQLMTVMSIMLASGVVICVLTTLVVVSRLVTLKKEELYF